TCIKGHRATHCKHTDRVLVPIKKKGRPSTQCKRCRELRIIRQLHVKCDCEDQSPNPPKKKKDSTIAIKKKMKIDILRPIAPKQEVKPSCCGGKKMSIMPILPAAPVLPMPPKLPAPPALPASPMSSASSISSMTGSCCTKPPTLLFEAVPLPNIPPPTSCCGPPSKNQQGETIRVVTCRCGDSCACIGCDAHPSRAMKEGKNDVYIGFDSINNNRRLSIASMCSSNTLPKLNIQSSEMDHPSSILSEDGVLLCGCGCSKTFEDCSGCFSELCQEGYL
ncbi:hypothetical protein INT47_008588, partial [Mucor saturninus]